MAKNIYLVNTTHWDEGETEFKSLPCATLADAKQVFKRNIKLLFNTGHFSQYASCTAYKYCQITDKRKEGKYYYEIIDDLRDKSFKMEIVEQPLFSTSDTELELLKEYRALTKAIGEYCEHIRILVRDYDKLNIKKDDEGEFLEAVMLGQDGKYHKCEISQVRMHRSSKETGELEYHYLEFYVPKIDDQLYKDWISEYDLITDLTDILSEIDWEN